MSSRGWGIRQSIIPYSYYIILISICQAPKRKKVALTVIVAESSSVTPLKRKFFLLKVAPTRSVTARFRVAATPQKSARTREKSHFAPKPHSKPKSGSFVMVWSKNVGICITLRGYLQGFVRNWGR